MRNDEGGKKENFGWGQVLVSGGGWWWLVILAGVEKGMWGSWNVLECLEQSGIIEWIWNKKRQTEVPRWKNVLLGRLKKHSIHSDSFTGPRTFLRWHHREYNPPPFPPPTYQPCSSFHTRLALRFSHCRISWDPPWYTGYSLPLKFVYIIAKSAKSEAVTHVSKFSGSRIEMCSWKLKQSMVHIS